MTIFVVYHNCQLDGTIPNPTHLPKLPVELEVPIIGSDTLTFANRKVCAVPILTYYKAKPANSMWPNWLTYIQVLTFYQLTSQCAGETVLKTLIPLKEDLCNTSKCQISMYWVISTVESFECNAVLFRWIEFAPIFQDNLHLKPAIDKEQESSLRLNGKGMARGHRSAGHLWSNLNEWSCSFKGEAVALWPIQVDHVSIVPENFASLGVPHASWTEYQYVHRLIHCITPSRICIGVPRSSYVVIASGYYENFKGNVISILNMNR